MDTEDLSCVLSPVVFECNLMIDVCVQGPPGAQGEPGESNTEVGETKLYLDDVSPHVSQRRDVHLRSHHQVCVCVRQVQQLKVALKILAERVLILEHMIGVHGQI